uniref:Uncharacterized protein n=1 Tax=Oryza barthii TaxID=65489 RepID=A0A0D3GFM1_9ORYZ
MSEQDVVKTKRHQTTISGNTWVHQKTQGMKKGPYLAGNNSFSSRPNIFLRREDALDRVKDLAFQSAIIVL